MGYNRGVGDTAPSARDRYTALLQAQPPFRRLAQVSALISAARELALAGLRQRHPDASDDELRVRLTVRLYGRDTAARLFGADRVPADAL